MSSSHFITLLVLYLVLLLNSLDTNMAARIIPSSAPSTVTRPLFGETNYLKPHLDHKQKFFQGRQVKNCLPKGYRHNSAPSRFVNYDTLGGCSGIHSDKPWNVLFWIWERVLYLLEDKKNQLFLLLLCLFWFDILLPTILRDVHRQVLFYLHVCIFYLFWDYHIIESITISVGRVDWPNNRVRGDRLTLPRRHQHRCQA